MSGSFFEDLQRHILHENALKGHRADLADPPVTDDLMEELLIDLGYGEGVRLIRETGRWYA